MKATQKNHDWHCEDHNVYGWRGDVCKECTAPDSKHDTWLDLPEMEDVARAKVEGWEIEYRTHDAFMWCEWERKGWRDNNMYRGRPKQPKTKAITLRKALMTNSSGVYYTSETSDDLSGMMSFVQWLGEPYDIEVPE